jgi:adenylate cyclase
MAVITAKTRARARPLHITVLQLVITLVVATAAGIGVSTYVNTRAAVKDLTDRLMEEVSRQIKAETRAFLRQARPALFLVRDLLLNDPRCNLRPYVPPEDGSWRARAAYLLKMSRAYPEIARIFYGDRFANHTSVNNYGAGNVIVDHRWIAAGRARAWFYPVDATGRLGGPRAWPDLQPDWDVRKRPWYRVGLAEGSPTEITWTEPFRQGDTGVPGVTAALPLVENGRLLGIAGANIELAELDRFVQQFQSEEGRRVYLLNGDHVIAAPTGMERERAETSPLARLVLPSARQSKDPLLSGAVQTLGDPARQASPAAVPQPLAFEANQQRYLGIADRFPIDRGPIWTILVIVPEQQVLSAVHRNTRLALAGCLGALLLAMAAGTWLSVQIARPLRAFAGEMQQVGQFVLNPEPVPSSSLYEVEQMGQALDRMKTSLRSFAKYVPMDLVRRLHQSGREATLGGETARMSVLFSDIVGFTGISERTPIEALVEALAVYLEEMESVISAHGGIVDKYIGDAVMAFWGAPIHDQPEHARGACAAALEYLRREERRRDQPDRAGELHLEARMAIHTGEALVGNFGSQRRIAYTAIGDTVNLASRLEALNRRYGTRVLISETTRDAVADAFELRLIDTVATYGRAGGIRIYELLAEAGDLDERQRAVRRAYEDGFARYLRRDWRGAWEQFQEALALSDGQDGPSRALLARCEAFEQSPPPPDWKGVFVLTEK